jgi:hypothetical protein
MEPRIQPILESEDHEAYAMYQQEVTAGLKAIEDEVQGKYGCKQVDAMKAQADFKDDEDVQKALARVRTVFFGGDDEDAGGEGEAGTLTPEMMQELMEQQGRNAVVPEGMTADKFFDLFDLHLSTVENGFAEALQEAKNAVDPAHGKNQRVQYFQLLVGRRMPDWQAEAQAKVGMSEDDFQNCLLKYQADPRFIKRITQSQQKQMELTARLLGGDDHEEEGEESDGENDGVEADKQKA